MDTDTKMCTKCRETKPVGDFYKRSNRPSGLYPWCKRCFIKHTTNRQRQYKVKAVAYLGGKCMICGVEAHPCVYDFHHLRDKDKEVSKFRWDSWKRIQAELDKCQMVCSNCHRVIHYGNN
jgi:hypothetical protein